MKTLKLNFTIPEDTVVALRSRIGERKRSAFVSEAIRDKLNQLEQEELRQSLIEGYRARREEDSSTDSEWEAPTLEGWE